MRETQRERETQLKALIKKTRPHSTIKMNQDFFVETENKMCNSIYFTIETVMHQRESKSNFSCRRNQKNTMQNMK